MYKHLLLPLMLVLNIETAFAAEGCQVDEFLFKANDTWSDGCNECSCVYDKNSKQYLAMCTLRACIDLDGKTPVKRITPLGKRVPSNEPGKPVQSPTSNQKD